MARLLLVDDDADLLELQCLILGNAGHEVFSARTAESALDSFRARRPDIVIMDYQLPDPQHGAALLNEFGPDARVIVLSGAHIEHAAASRVLRKPCPPRVLLQAIDELL